MVVEIDEETVKQLRAILSSLSKPVTLHLFTTEAHCLYCNEAAEIIEKLASLSSLIRVVKCSCDVDSEEAKRFGVDKHPAIVIHGERPYNIRYFGVPSGYEFGVLVEAIVAASRGEASLPPHVVDVVRGVKGRVHVQVFVTPTCPYCPSMALAAYMFAVVNENVVADVVEAMEFPDLAYKYKVLSVPKTIINEGVEIEGAVPVELFAEKVAEASR